MAWVRFTADFDFAVKPNYVIAYKAGQTLLVKRECADQAIRATKAVKVEPPGKSDAGR